MILRINLVENYSENSVIASSSLPSPTGGVNIFLPYRKILCNMATTKSTTTTWAMRLSARPMTMSTSTFAWCTPYVVRASFHNHLHSHPWVHFFDSLLPFCFNVFFPVFPFYLLYSELCPELDNPIFMEILCYSANKESEDAYDVHASLTMGNQRALF